MVKDGIGNSLERAPLEEFELRPFERCNRRLHVYKR